MALYAIGDIQGCYERLRHVLACIGFDPEVDHLWVAGDLVNRGPDSLATLRFLRELGDATTIVLGNHDLHLLAVALGGRSLKRKDTLADVLDAPDAADLIHWLRQQHMAVFDPARNLFMAHAGLPHIWSVPQACTLACELEALIRGPQAADFFAAMYGNDPACWADDLTGMVRARVVTNYLTRMRFVRQDGTLDLLTKEGLDQAPKGYKPWFAWPRQDQVRVLFGHWAALEGRTGSERFIGLDTGCVWGGALTVMNLDTGERTHCDC